MHKLTLNLDCIICTGYVKTTAMHLDIAARIKYVAAFKCWKKIVNGMYKLY